ncbi:hypothetical protein [Pseudomonas paralcaligenes]|uniref:hypothetical protein n=1 Tax=Pseudomonas paralcaligenes TaxID=2772558 RepID=UPI0035711592
MLVTLFCLLARPARDEQQQAALLPFADDPPAARRLERDTGRRCEALVEVPFEPLSRPPGFHLDA